RRSLYAMRLRLVRSVRPLDHHGVRMLDRTAPHRRAQHRQGAGRTHAAPDRADQPRDRADQPRDREVRLEGAFNVRDLGGLAVTRRMVTTRRLVYRADSLDSLTERDGELLFGELGIGTIIDLRTP